MADLQENIKLSFDENQTSGYYVRVRFDILDDFTVFDCIIKFDDKTTALMFKNTYDNHYISKKSYLVKSSENIWLKQYHNKFLEIYNNPDEMDKREFMDFKHFWWKNDGSFMHNSFLSVFSSMTYGVPYLSTQLENISDVLSELAKYWNDRLFENLRYESQTLKKINDHIIILKQSIETLDDENELHLYKLINDNTNQTLSIQQIHRITIEKQEYEQLKLTTNRIDKFLKSDGGNNSENINEIKDGDYFLASDIDEIIFTSELAKFENKYRIEKINVKTVNDIAIKTICDISIKMCDDLSNLFFLNPSEFTKTEQAKKWFDSETLSLMDFDIRKINQQYCQQDNQQDNRSNKNLCSLCSTYIHKRYRDYLEELIAEHDEKHKQ